MDPVEALRTQTKRLCDALAPLDFAPPVSHVYNPLVYAREPYFDYLARYASTPKCVIYLGMNPGPFGMAQTGVPFGEIGHVRDYLHVVGRVGRPAHEHPKRPVEGFSCKRSEVSGARLWGAIKARHADPREFFARAFVANYCPLVFMEASGRNRTPDKLAPAERSRVFEACDHYLRGVVDVLCPRYVIGIGKFAAERAAAALADRQLRIGSIPHPSPANPAANRDWAGAADTALKALGLTL